MSESGDRGLDPDGFLAREGALTRVPEAFAPLVEAVRCRDAQTYGPRLHSAYLYGSVLYGSVPRGTARSGRSDLDLLIALRPDGGADAPTARDACLAPADPSEYARAHGRRTRPEA